MNTQTLATVVAATLANSFSFVQTTEGNELAAAGYAELNPNVPNTPEGQIAARATSAGINYHNSLQGGDSGNAFAGFGGNTDAGQMAQGQATTGSHAVNPAGGVPQSQGTTNAGAGATDPNAKPVFIRNAMGGGFNPDALKRTGKGDGAKREQPEKYPFGELNAPTQNGVDANGQPTYAYDHLFVASSKHTKGDKAGQLRTSDEMAFSLQSACSAANRRYATVKGQKTVNGKTRNEYEYSREFRVVPGTGPNGEPGAYIYRAK